MVDYAVSAVRVTTCTLAEDNTAVFSMSDAKDAFAAKAHMLTRTEATMNFNFIIQISFAQ